MLDQPTEDAVIYAQGRDMTAIAMTDLPQIGHVVDALDMVRVPVPRPMPNEVAIKLAASAMHIDEIYAAQGTSLGRFFGPKDVSEQNPYIMGSSVSGTVVAVGAETHGFAVGDDVIVIPHHTGEIGSWATYRCVAANMVMHKSAKMTHVQAAALTMAGCVAWGAIDLGNIKPGQKCMVVGASGAIGSLMVQILRSKGASITGVCSGRNAPLARSLGAQDIIDYTQQDFGDAGLGRFDAVFDTIGGRQTEHSAMRRLKRSGCFVTIVGPKQHIGENRLSWPAVLGVLGYVGWRFTTSFLRGPRYIFGEKLPRNTIHDAMAHIVEQRIEMPIDREIPFLIDAVKDGINHLTSHRAKGRIVINFENTGTDAQQERPVA